MTRSEITAFLAAFEPDDARAECSVILEELFGVSPAAQLASPGRDYSSAALTELLLRRKKREPLAYITGKACFCSETYTVSPGCLIPRRETELLTEAAAKYIPRGASTADLCTGSGCIAVSLSLMRPDLSVTAADISSAALDTARANARQYGKDGIRFVQCDVLSGNIPGAPFDAAVSNPPYIRSADIPLLQPEVGYEPRAALDGGGDGLDFYRSMIKNAHLFLCADGILLFELGAGQADSVRAEANAAGFDFSLFNDYSGVGRVALLKRCIPGMTPEK